ncbi:carboxylesterase family protein [Limnoglobus roseus]|uniref:Putative alpha/beta-hydrolase-type carbohydrate esterase n=1 Tax=Limnoglobus roseus TaxID=2598579 RepID=A0A5C1A8R0_9BACT|nr:dienelactone hydrolase family protein [Limnoglobus roseus]QEL14895.1 putative alpha/beta-hydrolase-type carbohydrate esterase [Limnoglobus roseus]
MLRLFLLMAVAMIAAPVAAADPTGFVNKTFKNEDGHESPYVVYVPPTIDTSKPVPVMLFLHGAGETKGGSMMPIEQGLAPHIKRFEAKKAKFPFVVVIPQAETRGWLSDGPNAKRAVAMLDATMKEYNGDPKRTYLTGLSMGGFGTWSLAAAFPDRWAAIVPICGAGKAEWAEKIKDIPCWVFHGVEDKAVNVKGSRDMVEALKKAGGEPRYSEFPYAGHNSWDAAYSHEELYPWLLSHTKK